MPKDASATWKSRRQRWLRFVQANIKAMNAGAAIPLGPSAKRLEAPAVEPGAGKPIKVVVCSPHPDDEALVGALPLRVHQECGASVTNCAITLGSNVGQRARRWRELEAACAALGFGLTLANPPGGFDQVNCDNRENHPEEWAGKVRVLSQCWRRRNPTRFLPRTRGISIPPIWEPITS